ncbi:hypothetical protein SBA3_1850023 [Candidatus Sulfopaludibacter sp. SbA3]|nr:hypothetical protein SBA3_1850023 [Candidatus Sulfopaludibacter sp. SbA3]
MVGARGGKPARVADRSDAVATVSLPVAVAHRLPTGLRGVCLQDRAVKPAYRTVAPGGPNVGKLTSLSAAQ